MSKINSRETVNKLNKIFIRLGYPRTITLDNAKQFIAKEFEEYCKLHGIHLNHSAPYWPKENGLVERQNRSLLKRLQISNALRRDWKKDLNDYLIMYYTTPHSTTGKTPTELCFGRTIRSKIPSIEDIETIPVSSDYRDKDIINKQQGKEREDRRRHAHESDIKDGDIVLMRNLLPANKLATTFGRSKYKVTKRTGARAIVEDQETGVTYERNIAHLKKVNPSISATTFNCEDYNNPTFNESGPVMTKESTILPSDDDEPEFRGFSSDD